MTGFVPTRQLVLVDLLALMLATGPGQRTVIAVDGAAWSGRARLVGEMVALAPHVAGRQVRTVSVDSFPRSGGSGASGAAQDALVDLAFDQAALRARVLEPFRAGSPLPTAAPQTGPAPDEQGQDALLIVEGPFLRRPELRGWWDATCLVTAPEPAGHPDAGRYAEAHRSYRLRSRTWQPDWIVDTTDPERPELIVPDPDAPQWFDA